MKPHISICMALGCAMTAVQLVGQNMTIKNKNGTTFTVWVNYLAPHFPGCSWARRVITDGNSEVISNRMCIIDDVHIYEGEWTKSERDAEDAWASGKVRRWLSRGRRWPAGAFTLEVLHGAIYGEFGYTDEFFGATVMAVAPSDFKAPDHPGKNTSPGPLGHLTGVKG